MPVSNVSTAPPAFARNDRAATNVKTHTTAKRTTADLDTDIPLEPRSAPITPDDGHTANGHTRLRGRRSPQQSAFSLRKLSRLTSRAPPVAERRAGVTHQEHRQRARAAQERCLPSR